MKSRFMAVVLSLGFFLALGSLPANADSVIDVRIEPLFSFGTLPESGDVEGPAGTTVGWGYWLQNDSKWFWLVTTGIYSDEFLHGSAKELIEKTTLAPGATWQVEFNEEKGEGLYALTWDKSAPEGFVNYGAFLLTADLYDGDPTAGGRLIGSSKVDTKYSAAVTARDVPEPTSLLLLGSGLVAMLLTRRRSS
jgi:hypothetical protein